MWIGLDTSVFVCAVASDVVSMIWEGEKLEVKVVFSLNLHVVFSLLPGKCHVDQNDNGGYQYDHHEAGDEC